VEWIQRGRRELPVSRRELQVSQVDRNRADRNRADRNRADRNWADRKIAFAKFSLRFIVSVWQRRS
jgi:hypothetical protein